MARVKALVTHVNHYFHVSDVRLLSGDELIYMILTFAFVVCHTVLGFGGLVVKVIVVVVGYFFVAIGLIVMRVIVWVEIVGVRVWSEIIAEMTKQLVIESK